VASSAFLPEEVLLDGLLPGCREVLWEIKKWGYEIAYLTAREWDRDGTLTKQQLQRFALPEPTQVHVVSHLENKAEFLRPLHCSFYVDDFMTGQERSIGTFHAETARAIEALGVHVIPFRNDWADVLVQMVFYGARP